MDISYILNHLGEDREKYFNAVSPPVIQTSNFCFNSVDEMRQALKKEFEHPFYTRGINPTVSILRKKLAALEKAEDALVFSSGSAAIAAAVMNSVKAGDHVVCVKNPYGWTQFLFENYLSKYGIETTFVDGTFTGNFQTSIKENTRLFCLESPNSITFQQQDIIAVCAIAGKNGIRTIIDNSYSSPLFQNPIEMGADLVVHSATKYISGHSDVVAGVVCGSKAIVSSILENEYMTIGAIIHPFDAWQLLKGLRTLQIRMERVSESTARIIEHLKDHPKIEKIFYPFLESNPQYELSKKQMKKGAGQFSVLLKATSVSDIEDFCNSLQNFLMACSWGGYESLVFPTCALFDSKDQDKSHLPWNLVRFYIGLEDPVILIHDFDQALAKL
jgi:cystathionine beta-lyase/cystathionine gamma-synthase